MFGTPVRRREDPALLRGLGRYVADLDIPGSLCVSYLISTAAHARLVSLDTSAGRSAEGVVDVVTAEDVELGPLPLINPNFPAAMARPLLASGTVRFVGEVVAAVVAETAETAAQALELIEVEFEPLPVVIDPTEALSDTVLLYPEYGSNVVARASGEQRTPTLSGPRWSSRPRSTVIGWPRARSRPGRPRPGGSETAA